MVQGFLKFARPEDMRIERVEVATLAADVTRTVGPEAEAARVSVDAVVGDPALAVDADPTMLRQALMNLAVNAVQAMPHGGTLKIYCEGAHDGRVLIKVRDTGQGIPADQLARIFDLYFTTKRGGSGIGLSMVFRTVQLHHGDIDVESTPGVGYDLHHHVAARRLSGDGRCAGPAAGALQYRYAPPRGRDGVRPDGGSPDQRLCLGPRVGAGADADAGPARGPAARRRRVPARSAAAGRAGFGRGGHRFAAPGAAGTARPAPHRNDGRGAARTADAGAGAAAVADDAERRRQRQGRSVGADPPGAGGARSSSGSSIRASTPMAGPSTTPHAASCSRPTRP